MLKLNISSVALGALLATGAFLLMSQAGPGVPYGSWGPPKSGVVNIFQPATGVPIAPGASLVLYTVLPDRWLIITAAKAQAVGCALSGSAEFRFAEQLGATITEKGPATGFSDAFSSGSAVGWVFRPGSQVVITNVGTATCQIGQLSVLGYQTRD